MYIRDRLNSLTKCKHTKGLSPDLSIPGIFWSDNLIHWRMLCYHSLEKLQSLGLQNTLDSIGKVSNKASKTQRFVEDSSKTHRRFTEDSSKTHQRLIRDSYSSKVRQRFIKGSLKVHQRLNFKSIVDSGIL